MVSSSSATFTASQSKGFSFPSFGRVTMKELQVRTCCLTSVLPCKLMLSCLVPWNVLKTQPNSQVGTAHGRVTVVSGRRSFSTKYHPVFDAYCLNHQTTQLPGRSHSNFLHVLETTLFPTGNMRLIFCFQAHRLVIPKCTTHLRDISTEPSKHFVFFKEEVRGHRPRAVPAREAQ